jgi:hypothetical protein
MVIALLAVLGVNLIVLSAFVASVLSRKRWVRHQPGVFAGAIDGLGPKWRRGYGRWVRDVLVWMKAPFLLRNELVAADGLAGQRPADPDEVKRLGDNAVVGPAPPRWRSPPAVRTAGCFSARVSPKWSRGVNAHDEAHEFRQVPSVFVDAVPRPACRGRRVAVGQGFAERSGKSPCSRRSRLAGFGGFLWTTFAAG